MTEMTARTQRRLQASGYIKIVIALLLVSAVCWYFFSGSPDLALKKAKIVQHTIDIPSPKEGLLTARFVPEGAHVEAGEPLFALDGSDEEAHLSQEITSLIGLESQIPPEMLENRDDLLDLGSAAPVALRFNHAKKKEEQLSRQVTDVSLLQAQAKLKEVKAGKLAMERNTPEKTAQAKHRYEQALRELVEAQQAVFASKEAYEKASHARALFESELRRMRAGQASTSPVSLSERIQAYNRQAGQVLRAVQEVHDTQIKSPVRGTVVFWHEPEGAMLGRNANVVTLAVEEPYIYAQGLLPGKDAPAVRPGMPCRLRLRAGNQLEGIVISVIPLTMKGEENEKTVPHDLTVLVRTTKPGDLSLIEQQAIYGDFVHVTFMSDTGKH